MAVQSSFYVPDGSTRTFPSTKHIATKQHVGVYLQRALDSVWETALSTSYELVNNSIVFDSAVDNILYLQIEIRVVDTTAELIDSPSNIALVAASIADVNTVADSILDVNTVADNIGSVQNASAISANITTVASVSTNVTTVAGVSTSIPTVAGISANVTTVAGVSGDVTTVANSIANVNTNAINIADINSVATAVVPNIAEILLSDDNATTATTQAGIATTQAINASSSATQAELYEWEAEAERLTADSYATEAEDVFVNLVTSDGDGTFTYTPTTDYSALHWAAKASVFNPSLYAQLSGATFTGQVKGITPVAAEDLTRMDYVDTQISNRMSGFKNGIINPSFEVNQYADIDTAPVNISHNTYQLDRYRTSSFPLAGTVQRQAKSLINGKYVHSVKCVASATGNSILGIIQLSENFYKGEIKTFGAWVKSNNSNARLFVYDGVSYTSVAHSGGGGWEFLTVTKTISASATALICLTEISTTSRATVPITTGDYIESTMWQLEDGSVPTKYEQRDKNFEKDVLCKPFLPYRNEIGVAFNYHGIGKAITTTTALIYLDTKSSSRVIPTAVTYSGNLELVYSDNASAIAVTGLSVTTALTSKNTIVLTAAVASGLTLGNSYVLRNANSATTYIQVQTEL